MLKVLLVDDDPGLLAGLRRALLGAPPQWEVRLAKEAREGLDLLSGESADLVVSDMRMPVMDGATFLEHVKDLYPHTMRVILSGYSDHDAAVRSSGVAHQFLSKPCSPLTLLQVIEQARGFYEQLEDDIRTALADIVALPSPEATISALDKALDTNMSLDAIANIVTSDIALTAKVLQLANSDFFGEHQEVTDPNQAVRHLGASVLRDLANSDALYSPFKSTPGFDIDGLQLHASAITNIVRSVATEDREIAVVAAQLHDVGQLALASQMPEQLDDYEASNRGIVVGSWLLAIWGIPAPVIAPIFDYRQAPQGPGPVSPSQALRIAEAVESRRSGKQSDANNSYIASFGLDLE